MATRGILAGLICAAAAGGDPAPGPGPEVPACRLQWEPGFLGKMASVPVPFTPSPPEGVTPPSEPGISAFAEVPLGSGPFLLVAADLRAESPRLWIDNDRNRDLAQEPPIPLVTNGDWAEEWVTVAMPVAEEPVTVPVRVRFTFNLKKPRLLWWAPRVHRRGTVVVGGMVRRCALGDDEQRMHFDEKAKPRLLLDIDGDGRLDDSDDSPEWLAPGVPFRILDGGWTFSIPSPGGRSVEFAAQPTAPPAPPPRKWKDLQPESRWTAERKAGRPIAEFERAYAALPKDPDYDAVTDLLRGVGAIGTDEAFAFLKRVADSASTEKVRGYAVWYMANPAFVEKHAAEMAAYAKSKQLRVLDSVPYALFKSGHPLAEKVCSELARHSHTDVAKEAAYYLACTGTEAARETVLSLVRSHASIHVRRRAYEGLRRFPGGPAPEVMAAMARSAGAFGRGLALGDMASIGHADLRATALEVAAYCKKNPTDDDPGDEKTFRTIVNALTRFPDAPCAAAAIDLIAHATVAARERGTERLSALRAPAAVDALIVGLKSGDEAVRDVAAQVLARIPDPRVGPGMVQQFKRERSELVAASILDALGDLGDASALPQILTAAQSKGAARAAALRALAKFGVGIPEVRVFLLEVLASGAGDDRIPALDAVGASGDAALLPKVLPSLAHESWATRIAAAEAVRVLRAREGVPPLVARLAKEPALRVRVAIGRALFELTGVNLYEEPAAWQRWLEENGATFQVPETAPALPAGDHGGTVGSFFGIPVNSDRVVFVIDRSGSMDDSDQPRGKDGAVPPTRMKVAVREVLSAISRLAKDAKANAIFFDDEVRAWKPSLETMEPGNRAAMEKFVNAQKPGTATNIYDALERALLDRGADTVMLLTDGQPNEGKYQSEDDIVAAIRRINRTRRVAIHCVSMGTDSDLLKRLAAGNDGTYARR